MFARKTFPIPAAFTTLLVGSAPVIGMTRLTPQVDSWGICGNDGGTSTPSICGASSDYRQAAGLDPNP